MRIKIDKKWQLIRKKKLPNKLNPSFPSIKDNKKKDRAGQKWFSPHPKILADQLI